MERLRLSALTIRAAIVLGFVSSLGLWVFTGYSSARQMANVERDAAAINTRYIQAQELLATVRAQILLGSVFVRDALLDETPGATAGYRARLEQIYQTTDHALRDYLPVLDTPAGNAEVQRLRREIDDFNATTRDILSSENLRSSNEVREVLNTRIVPKREAAIRVSEEVQALNRTAFIQQQAEISEILRAAQQRIWLSLDVALALSVGIALIAVLYAGRLEGRLRKQSLQEALNSKYLQQLSAKLVTVQEEERRNIARELHDEVGQALTAIKVELAVAERRLDASGGASELLADAQAITASALHSVRDLAHLLHPALLDDLGLCAAIEWHLRTFSARHGVQTDLQQDNMAKRLAPEVEAAAFRIIQEALTNVAKHARAKTCRVSVRRDRGSLEIAVADDGVGFDAGGLEDSGGRRGLGLLGMRERAAQLQGTVRIESSPSGTLVRVTLPARPRMPASDAPEMAEFEAVADPEALGG